MFTLYNLLDLAFIALISYGTYYYYKKRIYLQLFEYFKIFAILTISVKLAHFSASLLHQFSITSTDTYAIALLIGFGANFALLFFSYKYAFRFLNNFINSAKIRSYSVKLITFLEVLIISTFLLFMTMQLKPAKIFIYPSMQKTIFYPKVKKFYVSFLNEKFVHSLFSNDSKTNTQELIFKSLKESVK